NERILQGTAAEIRLGVRPSASGDSFDISIELRDAVLESDAGTIPRSALSRGFRVPVPPVIAAIDTPAADSALADHFARRQARLLNDVLSEIHARLSFAASCLILVVVGAALGVLFRSGNFLSAFAVSVIPAVLCVALIVTGQHTAENIPNDLSHVRNALRLGIGLIYSGNVVTLILAVVLTLRLQRR